MDLHLVDGHLLAVNLAINNPSGNRLTPLDARDGFVSAGAFSKNFCFVLDMRGYMHDPPYWKAHL